MAGKELSFDGELDVILPLAPFPGFWPDQASEVDCQVNLVNLLSNLMSFKALHYPYTGLQSRSGCLELNRCTVRNST